MVHARLVPHAPGKVWRGFHKLLFELSLVIAVKALWMKEQDIHVFISTVACSSVQMVPDEISYEPGAYATFWKFQLLHGTKSFPAQLVSLYQVRCFAIV